MLHLAISKRFKGAPVALLAILSVGCTAPNVRMYDGPPLSNNEVAVIKSKEALVGIVSIDGRNTMGFHELFGRAMIDGAATRKETNHARSVEVSPGKRIVEVRYDGYHNIYAETSLWLVAEAGRTYTLDALIGKQDVRFWIVDDQTGLRVGGIEGSDDEPKN